MPLLVCPNDNAAMQTVSRSGVEFDFCPTCRGVWLDRGELEKLMAEERESRAGEAPPDLAPPARGGFAPPPREVRPPDYRRDGYRREDDRRDDERRYAERRDRYDDDDDDDRYRHRKRKGFSLLDIFD